LNGKGIGFKGLRQPAGGQEEGIGARAFGGPNMGQMSNEKLDAIKDQQCKLAWMKNTPDCIKRAQEKAGRRKRSVGEAMNVGFGPLVVPEKEELADEHPSAEKLARVLEESDVFVEEIVIDEETNEIVRDDIEEFVEVEIEAPIDQIEMIRNQRKQRKIIIITCMAGGCILLFALSVFISSRVSCVCYKDSRKNSKESKISTDVLASQIQKELASASNI